MSEMKKFIDAIHNDKTLRHRVNETGRALTEQNGKELRKKLAAQLTIIAGENGYHLAPEDFYTRL